MKAEPDSRIVKGKDIKACLHTSLCKPAHYICYHSLVSTTLSQWDPLHGKAFVTMRQGIS